MPPKQFMKFPSFDRIERGGADFSGCRNLLEGETLIAGMVEGFLDRRLRASFMVRSFRLALPGVVLSHTVSSGLFGIC